MPFVQMQRDVQIERSGLSLAEYAQHIGYDECAFWGVIAPPYTLEDENEPAPVCPYIWTKSERDFVARYLWEAEQEIQRVTRFPLVPRWITEVSPLYSRRMVTKKHLVVAGGVRGEQTILADAAVVHDDATMMSTITVLNYAVPAGTGAFDVDQVYVYHPGTNANVMPSSATYEGTTLIIQIPKCRLVRADKLENPAIGYRWDEDVFAETMDVRRVYNDTSNQAQILCRTCGTCELETRPACISVANGVIGSLEIQPENNNCLWGCPAVGIRLNYLAGEPMDAEKREAIVMLAHVKMPSDPCACGAGWQEQWKMWRDYPPAASRERLNCPFGLTNGAWVAWSWAKAMKVARFSPFMSHRG